MLINTYWTLHNCNRNERHSCIYQFSSLPQLCYFIKLSLNVHAPLTDAIWAVVTLSPLYIGIITWKCVVLFSLTDSTPLYTMLKKFVNSWVMFMSWGRRCQSTRDCSPAELSGSSWMQGKWTLEYRMCHRCCC